MWGRLGPKKVEVYTLSPLFRSLGMPTKARIVVEFIIFAVLGVVVGVSIVQPTNVPQALAAGLGWTGVLARQTSTHTQPSSG